MILLGQYDSPFVRRAAVALHHHGIGFEREVLSVFADHAAVLKRHPLGTVPALRLDDGNWIYDSRAIVEWAEGSPGPAPRLTADEPAERIAMLRIEAVAIGLAKKGYDRGIEIGRRAPGTTDAAMVARIEGQIRSGLCWLEAALALPFAAGGDRLTRADLALAVAVTYLREKQPALLEAADGKRLVHHALAMEALPAFAAAPYSADEAHRSGWRPEA